MGDGCSVVMVGLMMGRIRVVMVIVNVINIKVGYLCARLQKSCKR